MNPDLKIKSKKICVSKSPPPLRQDQILCAILCHKNCQDNVKNDLYILSYDEADLCNNYISKEQSRNNRFCINFPRHFVLGHVLLDTHSLDDVDLSKEVVRPTKKPRSIDPRKSKPIQPSKKTTNNKKTRQKNKKSRSVTILIPENRINKNMEARRDNMLNYKVAECMKRSS